MADGLDINLKIFKQFQIIYVIEQFSSLETKEAVTDNRNIIDDGKSQKLTQDDIKALKDKGIKGEVKFKGFFVLFSFVI